VTEVRRRAGKLREIRTSEGRRFLVLKDPRTERFLEVGATIAEADIEELGGNHARAAGMEYAFRLLALRDRTEREMRESLASEGISDSAVVEEIIGSLKKHGYLDDRRLAAGFIRFRMDHRPCGPHLLRRKLREAGVDGSIIEEEIESVFVDGLEGELARRLAQEKLRGVTDRKRGARRVHGFLSRRGFSGAIMNEICARILRGEISGDCDEQ
jgi:regulatory protein